VDVSPSRTVAEPPEAPSVRPAPPSTQIALRIARQLRSNLDCHRPSGDAFVVSVYGEWGIGKTHCLKSIQKLFAADLDAELQTSGPSPQGAALHDRHARACHGHPRLCSSEAGRGWPEQSGHDGWDVQG
jgi:hypothetical protein